MSEINETELGLPDMLPTGTVTLLLADVEGSTRLWQTAPVEMADAIARLDRALNRVVAEHGGVRPVEQGEGDSFVVAFTSATDAVACALDIQRAELAPIRVRIGVHTGDVQLRDEGNYIGATINKAARLRDLAHGGQTVLSAPPPNWPRTASRLTHGWSTSAPTGCGTCPAPSGWCSCVIGTWGWSSRRCG